MEKANSRNKICVWIYIIVIAKMMVGVRYYMNLRNTILVANIATHLSGIRFHCAKGNIDFDAFFTLTSCGFSSYMITIPLGMRFVFVQHVLLQFF